MGAKQGGDFQGDSLFERIAGWFTRTFLGKKGLKLSFLAGIYFLIIAAYTPLRDLKSSIFMATVGLEYVPWARVAVLILFVPAILLYSKIVDRVRRHKLLMMYSLFFAVAALGIAFFAGHPTIGIANTDQSPYRLFGWITYFLIEAYSPFIISVFWSYVNSVNEPQEAKENYGIMVGGSKLGGMLSSGFGWYFLSAATIPLFGQVSGVVKHQALLIASACFLLLIPIMVILLIRKVPGYRMHGYEAVYQVEKKRSEKGKSRTGVWAGLRMFVKYPYVLGIFGMIFFYETLAAVLSYLRLSVAQSTGTDIVNVSAFLLKWVFFMQTFGLIISLFGTRALIRRLGTLGSMLMIPGFMAMGSLIFFFGWTPNIVMIGFMLTKSMNYAFAYPVREQLYIPTLKEIKFKSKSWIDVFGRTIARFNGSVLNMALIRFSTLTGPLLAGFFSVFLAMWFVVAYFMGIRLEQAFSNNEVIGLEKDDDEEVVE